MMNISDLKSRLTKSARIRLTDKKYEGWGYGRISRARDGFILLWFPAVKSYLAFNRRGSARNRAPQ
jgi:hypothetical protein